MSTKNSKLLHSTAAFALAVGMGSASASAQDAEPQDEVGTSAVENDEPEENIIIVSGIRGSILQSVNDKRNSGQIVDTINAEDIGKSTDQNIAEALNRISGVSINTNDGEGTTISVRGANADQTVITLNGSVLGSTGFSQGVDLSAYSADILEKVEVVKTPSADDEEGSLAAVVNLITRKPLDIADNVRTATFQTRYNDFSENWDHKISGTFSQKFADDRFGFIVTVYNETNSVRRDEVNFGGYNAFFSNAWTEQDGTAYVAQAAIDADQIAADRNGRANAFEGVQGVTTGGGDTNPYARLAWGLAPSGSNYSLQQNDASRYGIDGAIQWEPSDRLSITINGTYSKQKFDNRSDGVGVGTSNFFGHIDGVQQPNLFLPAGPAPFVDFSDRSGSDPTRFGFNQADALEGVYDGNPIEYGGTVANFGDPVTDPTLNDGLLWTDPVHLWRTLDTDTRTWTKYLSRHAIGSTNSGVNRFENENYLLGGTIDYQVTDSIFATIGGSIAKSKQTPDVNIFLAASRGRVVNPWLLHQVPGDVIVPAGYDCSDGNQCRLNAGNTKPFLGSLVDLQPDGNDQWDNVGRTGFNPDDLDSHTLGFISSTVNRVRDEQKTLYADFDWETDFAGITSFEFGAKYTKREKFVDAQTGTPRASEDLIETISPFTGQTVFLDPSALNLIQASIFSDGPLAYDNFGSGLGIAPDNLTDGWATFSPEAALAAVTDGAREFTIDRTQTRGSEFENWAAYAKANFEYFDARLRGDIGLRYVRTKVETEGFTGARFQFDNQGQGRILDPIYLRTLRNSDQSNPCPVLPETPSPIGLGAASEFWNPINGSTDVNAATNYNLTAFQQRNLAQRIDGQGAAPAVPGGICYDPLLEPGALPDTFRERNLVRYSDLSTERFSTVDGVVIPTDRSLASIASADSYDYDVWLPSVNLSFVATDELIFRASAYRTMSRPPIDALRAGFTLNEGNVFNATGLFRGANIQLWSAQIDPLEADNLDLAVEWYFERDALLSANFFYKDISNLIESEDSRWFVGDLRRIAADPDNATVDGTTVTDANGTVTELLLVNSADTSAQPDISQCFPRRIQGEQNIGEAEQFWLFGDDGRLLCDEFQVTRQANANKATVKGVELQYVHNYNFLPGILSGLGIAANYTYQKGEFSDSGFPIPGTPEHSYNITGYWQQGGHQLRLAYSGSSDSLVQRSFGGGASWLDGRNTLDFSAAYEIMPEFVLTFEAQNLTDEPVRTYFTSRLLRLPDETGEFVNFDEGTIADGAPTNRTLVKYNTGTIFRAGIRVKF